LSETLLTERNNIKHIKRRKETMQPITNMDEEIKATFSDRRDVGRRHTQEAVQIRPIKPEITRKKKKKNII
jgi:hypothetical protein